MRPMAKNDPFIHKPYTLGVLCVLRGEFLQCTHLLLSREPHLSEQVEMLSSTCSPREPVSEI